METRIISSCKLVLSLTWKLTSLGLRVLLQKPKGEKMIFYYVWFMCYSKLTGKVTPLLPNTLLAVKILQFNSFFFFKKIYVHLHSVIAPFYARTGCMYMYQYFQKCTVKAKVNLFYITFSFFSYRSPFNLFPNP